MSNSGDTSCECECLDRDVHRRLLTWNERMVCALGRPEVEGSMNHHHDMFETSKAINHIKQSSNRT